MKEVYKNYGLYQAIFGQSKFDRYQYTLPAAELLRRHIEDNKPESLRKKLKILELFAGKHENEPFIKAGYGWPCQYTGLDLVPAKGRHIKEDAMKANLSGFDAILALYYSAHTTCTDTSKALRHLYQRIYKSLSYGGVFILHVSQETDFLDYFEETEIIRERNVNSLLGFPGEKEVFLNFSQFGKLYKKHVVYRVKYKVSAGGKSYSGTFDDKVVVHKNSHIISILRSIGFDVTIYELHPTSWELRKRDSAEKMDVDYYLSAVKNKEVT